jgi:hypothetical protein
MLLLVERQEFELLTASLDTDRLKSLQVGSS